MATKNWSTRLTETISYIENNTGGGISDSTLIVNALNRWKNNGSSQQLLSEKMSQEGAPNKPSKQSLRHLKRAMILLKCALEYPTKVNQWDAQVTAINNYQDKHLASLYTSAMKDAQDLAGSHGDIVDPLILELKSNTLNYLKNNKLTISGKKEGLQYSYGVSMRDGTYRINPYDSKAEHKKLLAINVPATLYKDVKDNLGAIQGTSSIGHDAILMLTTQFTGCTYCFSTSGGSLVAAHIDPGGGVGRKSDYDGVTISKSLRESGGFANGNGGTFKAFGRIEGAGYGYPKSADQMTIVGVKNINDQWEVYAQVITGGEITSAKKIS